MSAAKTRTLTGHETRFCLTFRCVLFINPVMSDDNSIASVVQRGHSHYTYNAKGGVIGIVPSGATGKVVGQTASTVSVQRANSVYTYDSKGKQLGIHPA